ncbi:MAG: molybdenum cofactor guanylyltransferase [Rhodothermales bacterium]
MNTRNRRFYRRIGSGIRKPLFLEDVVMRGGTHTGLVLAGGQSRRFGRDKSTYVVEGRRMIDRVVSAVRPLVLDVMISVAEKGQAPEGLTGRVVTDAVPGLGPLGGIRSGLSETHTPWLLVVACDMPYVTTDALGGLIKACDPGLHAVVATDDDGRRHPLCACFHRSVLRRIDEQVAASELSLHGLLDRLAVREVRLPSEVLRNVNRPRDLT